MATRKKSQKPPADASVTVRARSVESVRVDTLRPYERNARTHSESQLQQLVGTIRKLGFNDPLLIDESNMILSGHGRWEAAKRLGMTAVPCVRTEGMTDVEKRQAILAFNRIAQNAGWDDALLSSELTALAEVDIDLGVIGFEPSFIDGLLTEKTVPTVTMPETPRLPFKTVEVLVWSNDAWGAIESLVLGMESDDVSVSIV